MRIIVSCLAGLVLSLCALPPAQAATDTKATECRLSVETQITSDTALLKKAYLLMGRDLDALEALLPELETALARTPETSWLSRQCGDTVWVYSKKSLPFAAFVELVDTYKTKKVTLVITQLPYGRLGYVTGWTYYELDQIARAVVALKKGYDFEPDDGVVAGEYANALNVYGQPSQSLAVADQYLEDNPDATPRLRARMLRCRGYALIDLGRLDEAKAAYEDSLRIDPASEVARSQLEYIESLKKPAA